MIKTTNYTAWKNLAKAYEGFRNMDNEVYNLLNERVYEDKFNSQNGDAIDGFFNSFVSVISNGAEADYWDLYERFDSPGASRGDKPVAWSKDGYPQDMLQNLFKHTNPASYEKAVQIYNSLIKAEKKFEKEKANAKKTKKAARTK